MKNFWEIYPGALSSEYCDYVVNRSMQIPAVPAKIGSDLDNPANPSQRVSTLRWLDVGNMHSDIANTMMSFVKRSNRNNFGFDITWMNEIQFTEYHGNNNGHYDWHHDVFWDNPMPFDRKLSIVIQLSNPEDYVGGQFEFFGMPSPVPEQWSLRGSVLVFPSMFYHRVLPVTEGTRLSLVSWVEGPKWR